MHGMNAELADSITQCDAACLPTAGVQAEAKTLGAGRQQHCQTLRHLNKMTLAPRLLKTAKAWLIVSKAQENLVGVSSLVVHTKGQGVMSQLNLQMSLSRSMTIR